MLLRRPLSLKILFWFALNLALLTAAVVLLFNAQFHFNLDWAFATSGASARLESARNLIVDELNANPPEEWTGILQRYSAAYHLPLSLFDDRERFLLGSPVDPPRELRARLLASGADPSLRALLRTTHPTQYWLMISGKVDNVRTGELPIVLVAHSSSLAASGFIFNVQPWLWLGAGAIVFSFLLWLPLVRGITRALSEAVQATRQIADGRFDVRVKIERRDELGSLAEAINQMATRLDDQAKGQKRFLGDVAHELCSPLARLRLALGVLEQRLQESEQGYLHSANEKAEQIATLVNELLLFSKASFGGAAVQLQPVGVEEVVAEALRREECPAEAIRVEVAGELRAIGDPELLVRALGNLIRNALRHAGTVEPFELLAKRSMGWIEIHLSDSGPGISEPELPRIFDPFYRVDPSRTRETGGTGLGLTIVKSCVESCGGTVSARNRLPHGLEVILRLKEAPPVSVGPRVSS